MDGVNGGNFPSFMVRLISICCKLSFEGLFSNSPVLIVKLSCFFLFSDSIWVFVVEEQEMSEKEQLNNY